MPRVIVFPLSEVDKNRVGDISLQWLATFNFEMMNVIQEAWYNPNLSLSEVYSTLKKNGALIDTITDVIKECGGKVSDESIVRYSVPMSKTFEPKERFGNYTFRRSLSNFTHSLFDDYWNAYQFDDIVKDGDPSEVHAFVLLDDKNRYAGHVYGFPFKRGTEIFSMIGIRSSIRQMLLRKCGMNIDMISSYLINSVKEYALSKGFKFIWVEKPIGPMPSILINHQFTVIKPDVHDEFIVYQNIIPNYIAYGPYSPSYILRLE